MLDNEINISRSVKNRNKKSWERMYTKSCKVHTSIISALGKDDFLFLLYILVTT